MSVTKDDLVSAAKACGIEGEYVVIGSEGWITEPSFGLWNPLTDYFDFVRMCRQLKLEIDWDLKMVLSCDGAYEESFYDDTGLTDMDAATLVAAQIGRAL
jgi:hypothetical protein